MNIKQFFTKNWIHFAAVGIMVILTVGYFSLQFDGYGLKQHDIEQFKGAAHEVQDYRDRTGEQVLWTNSMFGGMPVIQISVVYTGNLISACLHNFLETLPPPAGIVLLYMLGFYVLTLCLRINPWVGLLGSIAFAFSYDIIILQAGHNSKALANAFMAPVVGAFILAYQRSLKWGIILSALFMTIEFSVNHLQVTYYLLMLLVALGLALFAKAVKDKKLRAVFVVIIGLLVVRVLMVTFSKQPGVDKLNLVLYITILLVLSLVVIAVIELMRKNKDMKRFVFASAGIIGAYMLALVINYGNISLTNDYAKNSIRGANDITVTPEGASNQANATTGLDKDYVTQYSNGIGESFTLISPYVKGSAPGAFGSTHFAEKYVDPVTGQITNTDLSTKEMEEILNSTPSYWGDQPQVSGPAYVGIIVFFLAVLGMVFLKSPVKWALFAVTMLAIALSWGKNYMGLTEYFLDNVPGYNKFRAPTIITALIELTIPLLGVMFLNKLVKEREEIKKRKLTFLITSMSVLLFMVILRVAGLGDGYTSASEKMQMADMRGNLREQIMAMTPEQMAQYQIDPSNKAQIDEFIELNAKGGEKRYENLKEIRKEIYNSSINRSILFLVLSGIVLGIMFYSALPYEIAMLALALLVGLDLIPVARNYLGSQEDRSGYKYWDLKANTAYPIVEGPADLQILENETAANPALAAAVQKGVSEGKAKADELGYEGAERRRVEAEYKYAALNRNSNYRVFDMGGGFNSAQASYFHKSLGGYHGAKLRNIQNVYDFHLSKMNSKVYDMLNVKYFLQQDNQGIVSANPNPTALGNAWFVRSISTFDTPNAEILALGSQFSLKNAGMGTMLVNNQPKQDAKAYGSESIRYVLQGDTLDVRLQNGMPEGISAVYVMDVNGKTNWIMSQSLALDTAKSFLKLVELTVADEFKPAQEAVMLQSEAKNLTAKQFTGEGSISMTSYAPDRITYSSTSNAKQFAVFSEIYYPEGWTATIDGKEAKILKTDYLMRGLEIPAGTHKIEFKFGLAKFDKSNTYARIGSILIMLLILGGIVTDVMKKRKEQAEAKKD